MTKLRPIDIPAIHASLVDVTIYRDGVRLTFGENIGEEVKYHTSIYLPLESLERVSAAMGKAIAKISEVDAVQN
jgi:hypothetical protein